MMRRYNLIRTADPSGVSGLGKVAEIAEFTDGTAVLRWCSANHPASTQIHPSVDHIRQVHCHPGTRIEPIDDDRIHLASSQDGAKPCRCDIGCDHNSTGRVTVAGWNTSRGAWD